jgi:hypothetical protein
VIEMSQEGKTWDDVKTFDDIPSPKEKNIITNLEKENRPKCPYLKKEGNFWYYCGLGFDKEVDKNPSYSNPVYQRHTGVAELQIWCLGDYGNCCNFQNG